MLDDQDLRELAPFWYGMLIGGALVIAGVVGGIVWSIADGRHGFLAFVFTLAIPVCAWCIDYLRRNIPR